MRSLWLAACVLSLAALVPPTPRVRLRVVPQTAIAPAALTVVSFRTPHADDRNWVVQLLADGDDIPTISSERSVEGLEGTTSLRLFWDDVAAGTYTVSSCVVPAGSCATAAVVIHP